MLKNKRGELSMFSYIGAIILIILGFLILLVFVFKIDLQGQSEEDICKISVLSRATSPESLNTYVPLKCKMQKICLFDSSTDGTCSEFLGEKVTPIKLPQNPQEAADLIEKTLVENMYSCWKMMGQGKISILSGGMMSAFQAEPDQVTCVICDRVAINIPDATRRASILDKVNINEYIAKTPVPESNERYLKAFTDLSINAFHTLDETQLAAWESKTKEAGSVVNFPQKPGTELAVVFSQIRTKSYPEVLSNVATIGGTATASAFFTPVIGPKLSLVVGLGTIVYGGIAAYNTRTSLNTAAGYCGPLQTNINDDKTKAGCSVIQVIPYDPTTLNNICQGGIDGRL